MWFLFIDMESEDPAYVDRQGKVSEGDANHRFVYPDDYFYKIVEDRDYCGRFTPEDSERQAKIANRSLNEWYKRN